VTARKSAPFSLPVVSRVISDSIVINADPTTIFDVLVDPTQHALFDGSGTVKSSVTAPPRLYLGATFRMRMHLLVPYAVKNIVVEYDEDRRIAWRHFGRHVWRYELEPIPGKRPATKVTETFDYGPAPAALTYGRLGFVDRARDGIPASLQRLKTLIEGRAVLAPSA
jgi:uncharacterized protein YndB with AHSA1/START domain